MLSLFEQTLACVSDAHDVWLYGMTCIAMPCHIWPLAFRFREQVDIHRRNAIGSEQGRARPMVTEQQQARMESIGRTARGAAFAAVITAITSILATELQVYLPHKEVRQKSGYTVFVAAEYERHH